jgi:hypothetical protein
MADNSDIPANLLARMSQGDIMQFRQALAASQGGGADAQRNSIAQTLMQQPQQALSGGTVQYSTPTAPTGVAPQPGNADIPPELLARMSPTDIALFRRASAGYAIPTGVAGPYGGGAMGQPQIPSGYNAFSGAGLPPANIGGGLTAPGGGSDFAGGGSPSAPPTKPYYPDYSPFFNQTPYNSYGQTAPPGYDSTGYGGGSGTATVGGPVGSWGWEGQPSVPGAYGGPFGGGGAYGGGFSPYYGGG